MSRDWNTLDHLTLRSLSRHWCGYASARNGVNAKKIGNVLNSRAVPVKSDEFDMTGWYKVYMPKSIRPHGYEATTIYITPENRPFDTGILADTMGGTSYATPVEYVRWLRSVEQTHNNRKNQQ